MKIRNLFLLLLACVGLAACEPDVAETWEGAKTNLKTTGTTAVLDLGNPDLSTEGYEIMTLAGTGKLDGETQLKVEIATGNDAPQLSLILNAEGQPVLFNRSFGASTTEFNAHTTALAYITMHPIFAPVTEREEFKRMVKEIEGAEGFAEFEELVANYIKKGQEPLTKNHSDVVQALEKVINGLCSDGRAARASRSSKIELPDTGPIIIDIKDQKINIQTLLLTPMYKGQVVNNHGDVVQELKLATRGDYTLKGFWWYSANEMLYNKAATIDMGEFEDGEYRISLDRTNTECVCDLSVNLLCNYLDVAGFKLGGINPKRFRDAVSAYVVARAASFTAMICDGKQEPEEIYEFIQGAALDFLSSDFVKPLLEAGGCAVLSGIASKLNAVYGAYCLIRGSSNGVLRATFALTSPLKTSFCLCKEGSDELTTCTDRVTLEMVDGDNQEAFPGEELLLPLEVRVVPNGSANAASHYNVHFETISGGSLSSTTCYTAAGATATTYWTLAEEPEVQQVHAYVTDVATGKTLSNEVWFTAKTAKHMLSLYGAGRNFPWEGGSDVIRVGTNCAEVEVSVSPSTATWLTAEYRPTGSANIYEAGHVHYSADENKDTKERKATVYLVGKDEKGKVVAKNDFVVTQNPYEEEKEETPEEFELDEFYSAWCYNYAFDYRGPNEWQILKFHRDNKWESEVWKIIDYDNGSADTKRVGYWYGTFTVKHNDYEKTMIDKSPDGALKAVYDITLKCTGTDTPDYTDDYDRSASSYVGQKATYLMQYGVSPALDNTPYVILSLVGDPLGIGYGAYLWDPAQYKKAKARNVRVRR